MQGALYHAKVPVLMFKAREKTRGRTEWPAQPAASAVTCGHRPEGMLPGPKPPPPGPLPSFLLQLSPAVDVPENSGRISSQEGDLSVQFVSPGSCGHQGARLNFPLTVGPSLSSQKKVCGSVPRASWQASGHLLSTLRAPGLPVLSLAPGAGLQRLLLGLGFCSQLHPWLLLLLCPAVGLARGNSQSQLSQ